MSQDPQLFATPATYFLKDRLRTLANEEFPAAARAGGYPVVFNHCFLRIVYDNLFGDQWQNKLPGGKAAIHQLSPEQLERAIYIGEAITEDAELCRELNRRSLGWRGKLK